MNRRHVDNDDFAAFVRRIIRAHGRRIAIGDLEALIDLAALSAELDHATALAVTGLRAYGYSWADIARPLGITRQAAQQRWADKSHRGQPTAEQLDGTACIACGTDLTTPGTRSYPAAFRDHSQVFACAPCTDRCHDSELADHRCPVCAGENR